MKTIIALAALAVLSTAHFTVSEARAASPGCTVNWVNGDCGKGPASEAGTGGFPNPSCNRHDPCDCEKRAS